MNVYLIKSSSVRLLYDEVNKIIGNSENVIRYNYDESNIDDIINECSYYSLLDETKYVIVNNFIINKDSEILKGYLDNINSKTILILISESYDKRNALFKKIMSIGKVIEINEFKNSELVNKIKAYCAIKDINIEHSALNQLIENNLNNYDLILNEIDKLAIINSSIILKDVHDYGSSIIKDEIFNLSDAIITKDYLQIKKHLEAFIISKGEVVPLVSILANQYRLLYAVKSMVGTNETIGQELNVHPYRIKLAKEKAQLYNKDEILNQIINLADLDFNIKSSNIDSYALLKIFIINT